MHDAADNMLYMAARSIWMTSGINGSVGAYAIPQDEFNELLSFTRTPTFAARRDRTSEFFRADKTGDIALKLLTASGGITLGCTITGAAIGGFAGGPPGAGIGAVTGLGIGIIASSVVAGVILHEGYDDWKNSVEGKTVVNEFIKIHEELPAFKGLTCSISKDIIKDPVQTVCGHTFERAMIENYHDKNLRVKDGPKCPECRHPFTKTQLTTDITYVGKVKKTYANVLKNEMKNPLFSPAIIKGFEEVYKGLDFQACEVLKQVSTDLTLQLRNGDLTPQAFSRKMREVTEIFDEEDYQVDLDKTSGQKGQKR